MLAFYIILNLILMIFILNDKLNKNLSF